MGTADDVLGDIIHGHMPESEARGVALQQLILHLGLTKEQLDFLSSLYKLEKVGGIYVFRLSSETERRFENSGKSVYTPAESTLTIWANYLTNPSLGSQLYKDLEGLPFSPVKPTTSEHNFTKSREEVYYLLPSRRGSTDYAGSVDLLVSGAENPHEYTKIVKAMDNNIRDKLK